ncbi:MAG TPA: hypothetical protein VJ180_10900 [Pyrinomonadaceae bacterium]|nr:hypothetical protein [Pyrinomonadaceae bacterium]
MELEQKAKASTIEKLQAIRDALLRLHRVLINHQRELWERTNGRIENSYEFLTLVMHHQDFAWLHHLSELVVQIDEFLEPDTEPLKDDAQNLLEQARFLMVPAAVGDSFQQNYFEALQNSPAVILAHSVVVKLLGNRASEVH